MNQYEAMFLFDPTFGGTFENCEKEVGRLMERAEAELLFCRKWDERRLAYKIKGRKRGVYVLTYFKAAPDRIGGLERDAQLSEDVLRVLVLRADHVTADMMEQNVPTSRERESGGDDEATTPPPAEDGGGVATATAPVETAVKAEPVEKEQTATQETADDEASEKPAE